MTVYISGPITKDPDYRRKFMKRAQELQNAGYEVVNPVVVSAQLEMKMGKNNVKYEDYLREDMKELLFCDGISSLPGWEKSKGAKLEHLIARILKYPVIDVYHVS